MMFLYDILKKYKLWPWYPISLILSFLINIILAGIYIFTKNNIVNIIGYIIIWIPTLIAIIQIIKVTITKLKRAASRTDSTNL